MIRLRTAPAPSGTPSTTALVAGRLALVGGGLMALGLVALGAQRLVQPAPEVALVRLPAPQVWLSSLALPEATAFAAPDYTVEPLLPRGPMPRRAPVPVETATTATAPVVDTAPVAIAQAATPQPAAVAAPVPAADQPLRIAVTEGRPQAVPPRRAPAEETATAAVAPTTEPTQEQLAALRAPSRSPLPRQRPEALTAPAQAAPTDEAPAVVLASLSPGGLLVSRTPVPRPETVARLASLDLGPASGALAAPRAPETTPPGPGLSVPALDEAVASSDRCAPALTRAIPRRPSGAGAGSTVIGRLTALGGDARDRAITAELLGGNMPDFLRSLVPVTFTGTGANGQRTRVTICVTPDYLAVGSDSDFVRVPLGLPAAMQVAERFDMVLPTTRMVDAIYAQASVRLSPSPMDPGAQMASTGYFLRHNATVEGQRARAGGRLGQLVSGHKKDLVLTNRLNANPGRVAIYGWHRPGGAPIQPLSTVHGASYADYSHGIRLVSRRAFVNGREVDLRDLLADSRLAGLVSSEGTITHRQMLAALR